MRKNGNADSLPFGINCILSLILLSVAAGPPPRRLAGWKELKLSEEDNQRVQLELFCARITRETEEPLNCIQTISANNEQQINVEVGATLFYSSS